MPVVYPQYREPCGWQSLLIQRCPEPAVDDELGCDLAVVGAGYTGLAAARTWAEARPGDRVAVLDASIVGEGSPGRNAGFLVEVPATGDAGPVSAERMAARNALIGETMDGLRSLVRRHDIRCQLVRTGVFRGAANARDVLHLERCRASLEASGLECLGVDADVLERRIGTRYYRSGLYLPACSLVQPAALVRGLADSLPANVRLYEETPALCLERERDGWRLECSNGSVKAHTVMLANNGFARELGIDAGSLRSRLLVLYTYAALTEPLQGAALECLGRDLQWGLLPAQRLGTGLRRTADGRLLVRACYGYEREEDNTQVARRLRACVSRRFPRLELDRTRPFAHVWGGAAGFTHNGSPVWGELAPGLWISAGCNGGGVVKGTLFGTLLARRALGQTSLDVTELFGAAARMPPEPLRQLSFAFRSSLERRQA